MTPQWAMGRHRGGDAPEAVARRGVKEETTLRKRANTNVLFDVRY